MKKNNNDNKKIGIFGFFAFTAAGMMSMVLFPEFARAGFSLIFFSVLAAFFWFIPVALASAEMGSIKKWNGGGVFEWVKNTLGEKWGFAAVFYQWFQTTIIYTIFFYFLTSGIDHLFDLNIKLSENNVLQFFIIIIAFCFVTFINLFGIKVTTMITRFSLPIGVILPTILLIILSFSYVFGSGQAINIPKLDKNIFPTSGLFQFVVFSSFLLSMTAVEVSANAIGILKKPHKNYPIVIGILVVTLITLNTLGGLSIALVLDKPLNSDSIFVAFETIIKNWFGAQYLWLSKIIFTLILFGIIGQVSAIIVEPSIGVSKALEKLNAPKWINKSNKFGVKYNILIIQTFLMIIWLAIITFASPGGENLPMIICIAITSSTYLLTYILLLVSHIKMSWKSTDLDPTFSIKNKWIKSIISSIGLFITFVAFVIMFFPPLKDIENHQYLVYALILAFSIIIISIIPFLIYASLKKRQTKEGLFETKNNVI